MTKISNLFKSDVKVINIGSPSFIKDYEAQGIPYVNLDWSPPARGDEKLLSALSFIEARRSSIIAANREAVKRIKQSGAVLTGIEKAINVIPEMDESTILHSGPPIEWGNMAGPMKGAVIGALIYEGKANNREEAVALAESGKIKFSPCHEHQAVGPMAGIISPSMPVHVVYDNVHGNKAFCTVNEGLGKVLRYGANGEEVIARLKWIEKVFAPIMDEAIKLSGGIDLKNIVSQALQMGDECHNRNKAATSLFLREITPYIIRTNSSLDSKISVIEFIKANEHYFLNLSMPMCKVSLDAGHGIENSTIVTAMARNGVEFGIRVSGLGNSWFTAAANIVKGLYFPGYSEADAALDIGDSAITETMGIGGFAMGGAPAIVKFVGGSVSDAINYSTQMYEITEEENTAFLMPSLDFRGTALGIDLVKVVETGILPVINTGIAHKAEGIGQIGAGIVNPPAECFEKALLEFSKVV